MNKNTPGLEAFVERHRADLDAFEPRPDLWEALERQLDAPAAADETPAAPLRVVPLHDAQPAPAEPTRRYYALAASVAAVLLLGVGYFWNTDHQTSPWLAAPATSSPLVLTSPPTSLNNDLSLYMGPSPVATAASDAPAQHLNSAVQRMETYYVSQIRERQMELSQLEQEAANTPDAEWRQELSALDSTYRQLKVELYRNPEPDVVLDAMNRNLQIRLDILNQQLRTRERIDAYGGEPYILAEQGHRK